MEMVSKYCRAGTQDPPLEGRFCEERVPRGRLSIVALHLSIGWKLLINPNSSQFISPHSSQSRNHQVPNFGCLWRKKIDFISLDDDDDIDENDANDDNGNNNYDDYKDNDDYVGGDGDDDEKDWLLERNAGNLISPLHPAPAATRDHSGEDDGEDDVDGERMMMTIEDVDDGVASVEAVTLQRGIVSQDPEKAFP